jgi:hypothetical protein
LRLFDVFVPLFFTTTSTNTMRTSLLICGLIAATASAAVVDTNFMDEREKLAKDWTGKGGDPAEKYFRKLFLDVVIVVVSVTPLGVLYTPCMDTRLSTFG